MAANCKEVGAGNSDATSIDSSSAGMNILYLAVLRYSLEPILFLEREDIPGKVPGRIKSSYVFILENPSISKEATNRLIPHSIRTVKSSSQMQLCHMFGWLCLGWLQMCH
ncbi:rCG28742 [Rattus norvegicus]|uniref:RCG28742 n=1 Tax=Rattus norvegicus TaxID=10116 RepID=A6HVB5_RAT|nr:rCG28742 [Rattus norvegicus]